MKILPAALLLPFCVFALVLAPDSRAEDKPRSKSKTEHKDQPKAEEKSPAGGHKPTNDIEKIAWRNGLKAVNRELETLQERCGFKIPVEVVYDVPMKTWVEAEEWGLRKGCSNEAKSGGCVHLSWCGTEIISGLWFNFCDGGSVRTDYKGWDSKVKRLVCRGDAPVPGTSRKDSKYSKMKASLADDGTLTVILHPSDSNVSSSLYQFLEPRLEAD